jgi:hypothetical protein
VKPENEKPGETPPLTTAAIVLRGGRQNRHGELASMLVLGAVCGFAWAAGFRGMMSEIAGEDSDVDGVLTFVWLLLPGVVVGCLLAWAEHIRRTGGRRGWRWLALSPLLFAGVLLSNPTDPGGLFEDGVGGGAVAIPLFAIAGGFALSGRGARPPRLVAGLVALAPIPLWALTATSVGGAGLALDTARGAWVALYFWAFLALLALACAIPHRQVDSRGNVSP